MHGGLRVEHTGLVTFSGQTVCIEAEASDSVACSVPVGAEAMVSLSRTIPIGVNRTVLLVSCVSK